jgi:cytoskeletal protein CcmA (bactofilin family)
MFMSKKEETAIKAGKAETIGTLIGQGTVLDGTVTTKETIRIDGLVKGEIHSEGNLIVGETGRIEGNVHSRSVLNAGYIHGNLKVDERLEITSTGTIVGDIVTVALVIEEGASFKGNCSMQTMVNKSDIKSESGEAVKEDVLEEKQK